MWARFGIDRWDIVIGHYWYYVDFHRGQWSREYERMCRIGQYYRPSYLANGPETEGAQMVYDALVERYQGGMQ